MRAKLYSSVPGDPELAVGAIDDVRRLGYEAKAVVIDGNLDLNNRPR
jgi:hypothetical protein